MRKTISLNMKMPGLCWRLVGLTLVIALLLPPHVMAASDSAVGEIDFGKFKEENFSRKPELLMKAAWRNVTNERYDSAAAYYSLVASQFSESLPLPDKRRCAIAAVNMGYIWLAWRLNAAEAYPWLMRARELAAKYGFDFIETAVISNIGQIAFDYNNLPKAVELYKTALDRVCAENNGSHYYSRALIDFATAALVADRDDLIKDLDIRNIDIDLPEDEPLHAYIARLSDALRQYAAGNYHDAAIEMEDATPLFNLATERKRYLTMHHIIAGKIWMEAGEFERAQEHFKEVIRIASREGLFNFMEKGYAYLEECGDAMGDRETMLAYRYRGMQIRDSLFNAVRFETVKDLETAGEINKLHEDVRESVRQAAEQRRVMAWAALAGGILLVALVLLLISHRRLKGAYREIYKSYMEHASQGNLLPEVAPAVEKNIPEVSGDEARGRCVLAKVREVMENGGVIFKSDFSVDTLAEMIGEKPKVVSQAINSLSGKNFNTLLGEFRVREACRLLADPEKMKSMSMEMVAESVGYRSRTYFSKVFKDVTGLTPAQFSRQARESASNLS